MQTSSTMQLSEHAQLVKDTFIQANRYWKEGQGELALKEFEKIQNLSLSEKEREAVDLFKKKIMSESKN